MRILGLVTLLLLASPGCYVHHVDSFEAWCEGLRGVDLENEHRPFWAAFYAEQISPDAVREDFANVLNGIYMEKVGDRTDRMVVRDGAVLHIQNLSNFFAVEPEEFISEWGAGVERGRSGVHPDEGDLCLFGTVTSLFDKVVINSVREAEVSSTDDNPIHEIDKDHSIDEKVEIYEIDTGRVQDAGEAWARRGSRRVDPQIAAPSPGTGDGRYELLHDMGWGLIGGAICVIYSIGCAIYIGRSEGIWAGIGSGWLGLVVANVFTSIAMKCVDSGTYSSCSNALAYAVLPWYLGPYITMLLCLPALPFFWLQERRNERRRRIVQEHSQP